MTWSGTARCETTYYTYSPGGRMTSRVLGNGCVTYFSYAQGQLARVENLHDDVSPISTFEYERDVVGNPLSILREDGYVTYYDYDAKYQLAAETQVAPGGAPLYAWEWAYDRAGNRTSQVFNGAATYYEYNAANELLTETTGAETTYYAYDHRGNQTAKTDDEGTTYFHYAYQNLLDRIDLAGGGHNYFAYDGDSKRISKLDSEGYSEFVYQGPNMLALLQERDESGVTAAQYTMGQGLESQNRNGVSSFYLYDALGSTIALTDINENITDTYRYNAWGEILDRTGTTVNPHTYVGKERYYGLPDAVLHLLGLRYYSPILGAFITSDAIRAIDNWYGYASAHPTSVVDPLGLVGCTVIDVHMTDPARTMNVSTCNLYRAYKWPGVRWWEFYANSDSDPGANASAAQLGQGTVTVACAGHESCDPQQWLESWDNDIQSLGIWRYHGWHRDGKAIWDGPSCDGRVCKWYWTDAPGCIAAFRNFDTTTTQPQAGTKTQFRVAVKDTSTGRFVGPSVDWWIYFVVTYPPQVKCLTGKGANPFPDPGK